MVQSVQIERICDMLEAFIAGPDQSLTAAGKIEVALDDVFPDDDEIQDYVTYFATYRPGGGEYLYDVKQIVGKSNELISLLKKKSATKEGSK